MHPSSSASPRIVIDLAEELLWVGDAPVQLRPKTWSVLCRLVETPGELVTKEELLDKAWCDTAVSEGTLGKSIGELRAALDDDSREPRCIETVARRGFRWIGSAQIVGASAGTSSLFQASAAPSLESPAEEPSGLVIGREEEVVRLRACLARSRAGQRQVVFVSGEAGAGKTTLVDRLLELARQDLGPESGLIARGQCIETAGEHEPYLPVFEALERLVRAERGHGAITSCLRRCAPTWVQQMPSLAEGGVSSAGLDGASAGRMLRELTSAFHELASRQTVVLVLEDTHWADLATTDLCRSLARQRDAAGLLLLVTMRTAEAVVRDHPIVGLNRDLLARGLAEEIALSPFADDLLTAYLAARCPGLDDTIDLNHELLTQTAGNPLFVRLVVDEWISRGLVARRADGRWSPTGDAQEMRLNIPVSARALLERQIARLDAEERTILEAASVQIGGFSVSSISGVLDEDPEHVERLCSSISRRGQFLRPEGRAGSRRRTAQYAFLHSTVQRVVASGLSSPQRRRLHLAAGEQLERQHASSTSGVSAQLAVHYEAAGEMTRALPYLRDSARLAMRRGSPKDAVVTLERVLELLDADPSIANRDGERLRALSDLSHANQLVDGFVAPQVAALWSRTRELATQRHDAREQAIADGGSIIVACVTARYAEAEALIREALPKLIDVEDDAARQALLFSSATVRYRIADLDSASVLFESALALKDASDPVPGADFIAVMMSQYAPVLVLMGRLDEARRMALESVARACAHSHYSDCVTSTMAAWALGLLQDFAAAQPIAARALELAEADNYRTWSTRPLLMLGVAAIREGRIDEGMALARRGLEAREHDGQLVDHGAHCCMIAEALIDAGRDGAVEMLEKARGFVATSGELYAESEIYRLRARARLVSGERTKAVVEDIEHALDLARLRSMHWHGLLAAFDLASWLLLSDRRDQARSVLEPALSLVVGGDEVPAVQRARALLARIAPP